MGCVLDTHVWIWSQAEPERLGTATTQLLTDPEQALFLSTISTLELARLVALGRVDVKMELQAWVESSLDLLHCATLPLSHEVAVEAYALPGSFHRDPADRIIVASGRHHGLKVVTADEKILRYANVESHDARI